MAASVTCGNIAVEKQGDEFQQICMVLPIGVRVVFTSLNEMVAAYDEYVRDEHTADEFYTDRREKNLKLIYKLDNILEAGDGHFADVNASNCGGGVSVHSFKAHISLSRHEGEGGFVDIKLGVHDTRCLLLALRRLAETWAEDRSEEYDEEGHWKGIERERIEIPVPDSQ